MSDTQTITRLAIFPLPGALLFPRMQLPLHIFEPRYSAMISEALARDRRIGMIQPKPDTGGVAKVIPNLFEIGCVGRISEIEALDSGRYNLVLEGVSRFRVTKELEVATPFRQVAAELIDDEAEAVLGIAERASLEQEARRYAEMQGYAVDWTSVSQLDDEALVNGIAQVAPFDPASKQALLEADSLSGRADLIVQLMQFYGRHDGDREVTLQ